MSRSPLVGTALGTLVLSGCVVPAPDDAAYGGRGRLHHPLIWSGGA
jgi:hypothetical protein